MTRILVVDDQPEVAELVQAVLKDEGYVADAVYSGQAALDQLQQTVYDLVVCDVRMPESGSPRIASQSCSASQAAFLPLRQASRTAARASLGSCRHAITAIINIPRLPVCRYMKVIRQSSPNRSRP